jgi:hypothetical protein
MVPKQPVVCLESLSSSTGKSWDDWTRVLAVDLPHKCGVLPLIDFLMQRYGLKATWAQLIALEYVLGSSQHVN